MRCPATAFLISRREVIQDLAKEGPCVIIGRCAEYILRDEPNRISVYICSPMEKRIERICRLYQLSEKEAQKKIMSIDKKRDSYYGYYAGKDWRGCSAIICPLIPAF